MGWWMLFGGILWLVFLGTIIYLTVYALGECGRRGVPTKVTPLR
jgi:hypothetical protein